MKETDSKESKQLLSENGGRYNCKECGKQIANKGRFYIHIKAAHDGVKYPCQQCEHQAMSKSNLKKHRKSVQE